MSNDLESLLAEFAERIRATVRKEMLDAFLAGAGDVGLATRKRGPGRPPKALSGSTRRKKGAKRDPNDLLALVGKLHAAIGKTPGQRIEQIAKTMGVTTKELALPAKKLLAGKQIKTTGTRRATKYFPR